VAEGLLLPSIGAIELGPLRAVVEVDLFFFIMG